MLRAKILFAILSLLLIIHWVNATESSLPQEKSNLATEEKPSPASIGSSSTMPVEQSAHSVQQSGAAPESSATNSADRLDDPCLPPLYKDWQEFSFDNQKNSHSKYAAFRIVIDRSSFQLFLEAIKSDGTVDELYRTHVGLGDVSSPTPEGLFLINHIYCYQDVMFFEQTGDKIPGLYNGFFAPLLSCDEKGRCNRFRDLGIHGFDASARPNARMTAADTYGAISAGCIRLPDPCRFKAEVIKSIGIGPLKKNDRGSYHWLNKPVQVAIVGNYPGVEDQATLVSVFQQGLEQIHEGIKNFFGIFGN